MPAVAAVGGHLHAADLATGVGHRAGERVRRADGANGIYVYAAQSSFPVNTGGGSNYWVDVVFDGTPPAPDGVPPIISGVQASSVGSTNATISWTTDDLADGQVTYGGTTTPVNPNPVTGHVVQLTGLSPATTYT